MKVSTATDVQILQRGDHDCPRKPFPWPKMDLNMEMEVTSQANGMILARAPRKHEVIIEKKGQMDR